MYYDLYEVSQFAGGRTLLLFADYITFNSVKPLQMYTRTIKCLLLFLLLAGADCRAQIGVQISQLSPYGDIGEYFNRAPAIIVYGVAKEDKWKERFGILYSHLTPRTDTVPIYGFHTDPMGGTQVLESG